MTFAQQLFSFEGRLDRERFWVCTLLLWAVSIVGFVVLVSFSFGAFATLPSLPEGKAQTDAAVKAALTLMPVFLGWILFSLLMTWPSVAVKVKRLHDRGRSGWFVLILLAPSILWFIPLLNLLNLIVWPGVFIYWLVDLGILEGDRGPNRFGMPASGAGSIDATFA